MGTCHVLMHKKLIDKISQPPYDIVVNILNAADFGEDGLYNVYLESDVLPAGYQGQQELILTNGSVEFRRDTDT